MIGIRHAFHTEFLGVSEAEPVDMGPLFDPGALGEGSVPFNGAPAVGTPALRMADLEGA